MTHSDNTGREAPVRATTSAQRPRLLLPSHVQPPAVTPENINAALDADRQAATGDVLRAIWVDLSAARGRAAVNALERSIRDAPPDRPVVSLFAGQIGSGKSMELRWLAERLERMDARGKRFHVIVADARNFLSGWDVRLPEFLVAMFAALVSDPLLGPVLTAPDAQQDFWEFVCERVKNLAKQVSRDPSLGPRDLAAQLRSGDGLQRLVSEALNLDLEPLLTRLSDVLRVAHDAVGAADWPGGPCAHLVVLFDGLDRVRPHVFADGRTSHDVFFVDQVGGLWDLPVHLVLTAPLDFLRRSTRASTIFQNPPRVLPMVPVHLMGDPELPHPAGVACLKEVLRRRINTEVVFADEAALDHAVALSGGSIRQLFGIVREARTASEEAERRLDTVDIDRGCQVLARAFEEVLGGSAWMPALHELHATGRFPNGFGEDAKQHLLNEQVVFEYNGTLWYDVNPVVLRTGAWRRTAP